MAEPVPPQSAGFQISELAPFVPLFQTLAWIALIAILLWRYRALVKSILGVIEERIKNGAGVKFPLFELEGLASQSIESQKDAVRDEVEELLEATPDIEAAPDGKVSLDMEGPPDEDATPARVKAVESVRAQSRKNKRLINLQSDAFLAEDLALRMLQSQTSGVMKRHVALTPKVNLDAVIEYKNHLSMVEVKLVTSASAHNVVQNTMTNLLREHPFTHFQKNYRADVLLCLVFKDNGPSKGDSIGLSNLAGSYSPLDVTLLYYRLDELKKQFGIGDEELFWD